MSKIIRLIITLLIVVIIIYIILSNPYFLVGTPYCLFICTNPNFENNIIQPNLFFEQQYISEIFPKGNEIISKEITKIQKIPDTESKLDEIFRWEMNDWHNPNWELGSFDNYNNSLNYFSYKKNVTKIRANDFFDFRFYRQQTPNGKFYGDDPYWIAFNKVGACRELSNLFAYMAQQSGIQSRTVQTINHQWVEVKVNGEWKYYDPWCAVEHGYYNLTDGNLTFKSKWYNYPEYFRDNCNGTASFIFYNEIVPNPLATQVYSISYLIHDIKKS
ncbi:MAG: transglutaminase domain-containing protein [Methanoregula sp.]|nr:transglutaminase domain-containing protein [Methanoregula sp.]